MKYKYLAINGEEVESETDKTREELLNSFEESGEADSVTPLVEIDGVEHWNPNTQFGRFTKKQWIKKVCPQLRKIYG